MTGHEIHPWGKKVCVPWIKDRIFILEVNELHYTYSYSIPKGISKIAEHIQSHGGRRNQQTYHIH